MGGKTQTQADRELNWLKGTNMTAASATYYLAAMNTLGSLTAAGTEVSGGSYARVALTAASAFSAIATGTGSPIDRFITNTADIVFPTATADWGFIPGWELYDAATVGNRLWWGELTPTQFVPNGQVLKILAGQLRFGIS